MERREFLSMAILPFISKIEITPNYLKNDSNRPWNILIFHEHIRDLYRGAELDTYHNGLIKFGRWSKWNDKSRTCVGTLTEPRNCFWKKDIYQISLKTIGEIEVKQYKQDKDLFLIRINSNSKCLSTQREIEKEIKYYRELALGYPEG